MSRPGPAQPSAFADAVWRTIYRVGFPLARIWWRLRGQRHEGALVAVHIDQSLLLVRSSYRTAWNFPGVSIRREETAEAAAHRPGDAPQRDDPGHAAVVRAVNGAALVGLVIMAMLLFLGGYGARWLNEDSQRFIAIRAGNDICEQRPDGQLCRIPLWLPKL